MSVHRLIQDIRDRLVPEGSNRIVVVTNPDGLLKTRALKDALLDECGIDLRKGDSLDLRILYETDFHSFPEKQFVFVKEEDFSIIDDIERKVDTATFQMRSLFRRFPWEAIREQPLEVLERLYDDEPLYQLSVEETNELIHSYSNAGDNLNDAAYGEIVDRLEAAMSDHDFYKAGQWMPAVSKIIIEALRTEQWDLIKPLVDKVNDEFQAFLKDNYAAIISSACGSKAPRIVTHVLPFIKKQDEQKTALVVIDGMNYWQSLMLVDGLRENLGLESHTDCIFSWLPSTTEWSRQAIFRGDFPEAEYKQDPSSEKSLWKRFWADNGSSDFQIAYQHDGTINEEDSVTRMAYVEVGLDEIMHSSRNYYYLYDATKRWVREKQLLDNIGHLRDRGYKIFITTDHGNIAAVPYRKLPGQNKLNANFSLRHIIIPPEADKALFEREHQGHLWQIDKRSRTYFAANDECFDIEPGVTHGGTHWLEVLIPFITIE